MTGQNQPFFIVGSERSGTTMLRLMLNEHPHLRIHKESFFISELMDCLPLDLPLSINQQQIAFDVICRQPKWQMWEVEEKTLYDVIFSIDQPYLSELVDAVFRSLCNSKEKRRWADKTPYYVKDMDRLHQLFPNAKFIHIIRDARDVCLSLRQVNWRGQMTEGRALYWDDMVMSGLKSGEKLSSQLYFEVKYEDLVLQTERTLKQVCAFLEEEYEDSMLNFYAHSAKEEGSDAVSKHHTKLLRPPQPSDVNRWKTEVEIMELAIIESLAGNTMDCVGQIRFFRGPLKLMTKLIQVFFTILIFTRPFRRRMRIHLPEKIWKRIGAA